jgi:hypothetical protein
MCTLPRRVRIIFSDLDGTLVHFEKHFRGHGSVHELGAGSAAAEAEWATTTCTANWDTQGIWPQGAAHFEDINAVCRTRRGDWREDECVVITVDDFGAVRLFAYPSDVGRAAFYVSAVAWRTLPPR